MSWVRERNSIGFDFRKYIRAAQAAGLRDKYKVSGQALREYHAGIDFIERDECCDAHAAQEGQKRVAADDHQEPVGIAAMEVLDERAQPCRDRAWIRIGVRVSGRGVKDEVGVRIADR